MPYSLADAPDLQFPPLALCHLGAAIRQRGHEIMLIDMTVSGMTVDDLRKDLDLLQPDVVGITCLSAAFPNGMNVAAAARQVLPNAHIVMGGMHPTFTDRATLERCPVDIIVRNEGEETLCELLAALEAGADSLEKVAGITYRHGRGVICRNPSRAFISDLDSLPLPLYGDLNTMPIYCRLKVHLVVTSRGCPHHCAFCSASPFWGHRWRALSPARVMDVTDIVVGEFGATQVVFGDDNFAFSRKRVFDLCQAISERAYGIDWRCSVRADSLTQPMLAAMREAGCSAVFIGVESGCQSSLNRMKKNASVEASVRAVQWCQTAGIETTCSMLMGLPWETADDIRDNVRFVATILKPNEVVWNLLHPDPGSEIYDNMQSLGLRFVIEDPERHIGNAPSVIETSRLGSEELNQLWMEACLAAGVGEEA